MATAQNWDWAQAPSIAAGAINSAVSTVDAAGNQYVTGRFIGQLVLGSTTLTSAGSYSDVFVAKLSNTGQWQWAVRAGGANQTDEGLAIAADAAGNVFVAGSFYGPADFGATTLTSLGGTDVFLARLNASTGAWGWALNAGSTYDDPVQQLVVDGTGNGYLSGNSGRAVTFGSLTVATNNNTGTTGWLARFTAAGAWQWAQLTPGAGINDLATDASGNVVMVGAFNTSLTLGSTTLTPTGTAGITDLYVAKLSGTQQWLWATASRGNNAGASSLALDGTGRVYLSGSTDNVVTFGALTFGTSAQTTRFVARLSATGTWQRLTAVPFSAYFLSRSMAVDAAGNAVVLGYFIDPPITFGSTTLTSRGGADLVVARLSSAGTWQWVAQSGGTSYDYTGSIDTDATGRIYVTGRFKNDNTFGSISLKGFGDSDLFSAEISTAGTWQWATRGGGTGSSAAHTSIVHDAAGNLYVSGSFRGTLPLGGITLTAPNHAVNSFVARYSPAGSCQWAVQTGGESAFLAIDGANNLYVTGTFRGTVTVGPSSLTSVGGTDVYVAKMTTAGVITRATRGGGTGDEGPSAVAADAAGNVWVAGQFYGPATFGSTNLTNNLPPGASEAFVARMNSTGAWAWARQTVTAIALNVVDNTNVKSIAVDGSGNTCFTGSFIQPTTFGGTTLQPTPSDMGGPGGPDAYVARLSSSGAWQWVRQISGGLGESGQVVAFDGTGNAVVAGRFSSPSITLGATTLHNASTGLEYVYFDYESDHPDVFVGKISAAGTWQWATSAGGGGQCFEHSGDIYCPDDYDDVTGMALDATGNIYVTGYSETANATFGSIALDTRPGYRYVAKLSATGAWQWVLPARVEYDRYTYHTSGYPLIGTTPPANLTVTTSVYVAGSFQELGIFGATTLTTKPLPSSTPFMAAVNQGAAPPSLAPYITSFTPTSGTANTPVQLTGTDFTGATSVTLGNLPVTFVVQSDVLITLTVPAGAQSGFFKVTTAQGTGVANTGFTYLAPPAPTISSISPGKGVIGDAFIITGANFLGTTAVRINGAAVASYNIVSATSIKAVVAATNTAGKVSVVTPSGTATSVASFLVMPTITSFTPTSGNASTTVIITGNSFLGTTAVRFNGVPCPVGTFAVVSNTSIQAAVPPLATTGKISVTTPGGTVSSAMAFTVAPVISSFTPNQGAPGSVVLVLGQNFVSGTVVRFNGLTATTTYNSTKQLTAVVPTGATTGLLTATGSTGTATSATAYTVNAGARPTITAFSPTTNVLIGTAVTITGTNFTGATAVRFNTVNAASYVVNSATSITATVPSGATTGKVYVTTPAGMAQSATSLTITLAPAISSFTPASGPVGTLVTINGANFTNASLVTFGGLAAASYTVVSASRITATVPPGAPSGPLGVTTVAGTATSAASFTRTGPRPVWGQVVMIPTVGKFFPNPARVWAELETTGLNDEVISGELYDVLGRVVRVIELREGITRLSLTDLPPGTYLLRAAGQSQRLVVE